MKKQPKSLLLVLLLTLLSACGLAYGADSVSGIITTGETAALPAGLSVTVQLHEVTDPDAPVITVTEDVLAPERQQFPIPYAISFSPNAIDQDAGYVVSARITDAAGNLLYVTDQPFPVITGGAPVRDVEIVVVPVGP